MCFNCALHGSTICFVEMSTLFHSTNSVINKEKCFVGKAIRQHCTKWIKLKLTHILYINFVTIYRPLMLSVFLKPFFSKKNFLFRLFLQILETPNRNIFVIEIYSDAAKGGFWVKTPPRAKKSRVIAAYMNH